MENEAIRGRIQTGKGFQDMGFLKALENRVIKTKAAHGGRGSDGRVHMSLCYSHRNNSKNTVRHASARSPELTGWRETHFMTCPLPREQGVCFQNL